MPWLVRISKDIIAYTLVMELHNHCVPVFWLFIQKLNILFWKILQFSNTFSITSSVFFVTNSQDKKFLYTAQKNESFPLGISAVNAIWSHLLKKTSMENVFCVCSVFDYLNSEPGLTSKKEPFAKVVRSFQLCQRCSLQSETPNKTEQLKGPSFIMSNTLLEVPVL